MEQREKAKMLLVQDALALFRAHGTGLMSETTGS
jgi:hypothetical protein